MRRALQHLLTRLGDLALGADNSHAMLELAERRRHCSGARSQDTPTKAMIQVGINTGFRVAELTVFRVADTHRGTGAHAVCHGWTVIRPASCAIWFAMSRQRVAVPDAMERERTVASGAS